MVTALILLTALDGSPAIATEQTPAPVQAAGTGRTRTLSDVARERKLGAKGVPGGTLSVAGAPASLRQAGAESARASPAGPVVPAASAGAEEAIWRARNADARNELAEAQAALAKADATLPAAVAYGPGARASVAVQSQIREGALLPYRTRVAEAQARVDALSEAARRAGAEPGWVR